MGGAVDKIITNDQNMLSILKYMKAVCHSSQPILITGETGSGKELISKALHEMRNSKLPFVSVNVAGLDDNVFSDTLFGHIKGAFTGALADRRGLVEKADGGTLFLDEIGDLTPISQIKLLRLIQEGEYLPLGTDDHKMANVRLITATNKNLWLLQRDNEFRDDLNFRLRTHHIHVPPLRERKADIPILVDYFFNQISTALNKNKPTPPKELYTLLETYYFPGNIRELYSIIYDAICIHDSKILSLETFKEYIYGHTKKKEVTQQEHGDLVKMQFAGQLPTIKQGCKLLVIEAMKRAKGNYSIASRLLGISRQALSKRLKNMQYQYIEKST